MAPTQPSPRAERPAPPNTPPQPHWETSLHCREERLRHTRPENARSFPALRPGETSPPERAKESAMQTNGTGGGHQHEASEKRLAPGAFPCRLDTEVCACGAKRWVDQDGNVATPWQLTNLGARPREQGGTPGLLENQGGRTALAKGGGPSSNGVRIPPQGLRRTRSCPALGQQPDGVPSFPLPGCRRQNKLPVQIPGIHLSCFQKPAYLPHTHHRPSPTPNRANPVLPRFAALPCAFHLGFGLGTQQGRGLPD